MDSRALLLIAYLAFCVNQSALSGSHSGKLEDDMQSSWMAFKAQHGRRYASEALDARRMRIFTENKRRVELFNEHLSESAGFELGLNHMSDWTDAELSTLKGLTGVPASGSVNSLMADKFLRDILDDPSPVPAELDWRKVPNRVTRVQDQGQCGCSWAFASAGVLEGQQLARTANKSHGLVELSAQNLVDCDDGCGGCDGCHGGNMAKALTWIHKAGGIMSEKSYSYAGQAGACRFNKTAAVMTDAGYAALPYAEEETLKRVVANFGPVAVGVNASGDKFRAYKSGVFNDPSCDSLLLDHAALVVGYGTDPKQGNYWIVKNSWGDKWGEEGYIRMSRNKDNQCGIATSSIVPIF